ncbi:hypothetical protein ES319_A11G306400v1 [Gossypium barbadense]|uniref:Uncharacterized protein n=2 Tax=Gossypium TaxID=3633 RepID=A0A5J5TUU0_GOSBA|nr:hypothetical protein ES319_A11G306400v1 [Gossypium barbadense]TYG96260.1 hypothetical protein ES288_A11G335100v1 [Gossypium darwinii]
MLPGRQTRFSHLFNLKSSRTIRLSIEDGNSFKAVSLKSRKLNLSMVSKIFGKISNLEQPSRSKLSRDFNL